MSSPVWSNGNFHFTFTNGVNATSMTNISVSYPTAGSVNATNIVFPVSAMTQTAPGFTGYTMWIGGDSEDS